MNKIRSIVILACCILACGVLLFLKSSKVGDDDHRGELEKSPPTSSKKPGIEPINTEQNSKPRNRQTIQSGKEDPPIFLTTGTGLLTSSAIQSLNLSSEDVKSIHSIISNRTKAFEESLAKKAIYLESDSNTDEKIFTYMIPALGDERKIILDSLRDDLYSVFDKVKADAIYKAYCDDPSNSERFAGLGKFDTKLKFHPNENGDSNIVSFTYTDPVTGKRISTSSMTIEKFKECFGDTFVFDVSNSK